MAMKTPSVLQLREGAGLEVAEAHAIDGQGPLAAADLLDSAVPDDGNTLVLEQAVLQDALGPEGVAAVHDRHLGGDVGEVEGLLDGGVAAADHHHLLAAEEEAVAGGAGRDAEALELGFRGQAQPLGLGAGGDHEGVAAIGVAGIARDPERPLSQFDLDDVVGHDAGADMLGLQPHLLHQPGALDDVGEAGIILDVRGDHELAAGLEARDEHRLQHGARRIDGGRVAGRPRADDDELGVAMTHGCLRERRSGASGKPEGAAMAGKAGGDGRGDDRR